jgi:peptidoglycan/LPS O-acetylase OafA/YrhL
VSERATARTIAAEPGSSAYRPDVDGLRALAILSVVAFHAFPEFAPGGFVGVDVFFVISGYLISSIILKALASSTFTFAEFYARRIRRLLPSLCVVIAATLAAGWFVLLPDEFRALGKHAFAGIGFASNVLLWSEAGYFDAAADTKPMLHLWSLGIEEQFYIVWPLLLWFAWKRGFDVFKLSFAITLASFVANVCCVQRFPAATFYFPVTRFWEILAGGLLAQAHVRGWTLLGDGGQSRPALRNAAAATGLLLFLAALVLLDKHAAFPGWWALLPVTGTLLLIAAGPEAAPNRWLLANPIMVWIGLVSYPLYLWHWPLLTFLRIASSGSSPPAARLGAVAVGILLAWLTYRLIDLPIRHGGHAARKVLWTCVAAASIAAAGVAIHRSNGMPARFADNLTRLTGFHYDYRADYREGTCFLRPEQDASAFTRCGSESARPQARSIVLWGDSHAAHLYPGLKAIAEPNAEVTELAASLCPPIIGIDIAERPHCRAINDYILQRIATQRPDRVLLAAMWLGDYDPARVADTIHALRAQGIENITLIGPVPHWKDGLPRSLLRYWQQDALHRVPVRMTFGLLPMADLDARMRQLAEAEHVGYVSPQTILCDDRGCLTQTDDAAHDLIGWDEAHLTPAGSRYLVARFPIAAFGR